MAEAADTEQFYASLEPFEHFEELARIEQFKELPADWQILVADVENSSAAIQDGRYKDVNLVGAASITAVLNALRPLPIPFVFGGDGCSLCVPGRRREAAVRALQGAQRLAQEQFGLVLRAGAVSLREIHAASRSVLVARFRASAHYTQAVFAGGGLTHAEELIKDPRRGAPYRIARAGDAQGDFAGLECRWKPVPSAHGEIVSLLVRSRRPPDKQPMGLYKEVLECIRRIYGTERAWHPVNHERLRLATTAPERSGEVRVRAGRRGAFRRMAYAAWLRLQIRVGRLLMKRGLRALGADWGTYKRTLSANTDYRKFDDMLRMVISGTPAQREQLTGYLENLRTTGRAVYGLHAAPTALMTCLIFDYAGEHIHFVDGSGGGYTAAATMLKQQLAEREKHK